MDRAREEENILNQHEKRSLTYTQHGAPLHQHDAIVNSARLDP